MDDRKPRKNFGGRPKREPEPGERVHLGVLVAPDVKRRLQKLADVNGRSMSQESELRLVRSLDREELLPEVLTLACSSKEVAGIATMLVLSMAGLGYRYAYLPRRLSRKDKHKHWLSDPRAFDQLALNIITILNALHPGGPRIPLTGLARHGWGAETAKAMVRAIRGDSKGTYPLPAETIRDMLGPLAARLNKADAKPVDIREWGQAYPVGKTTARNLADVVLNLINSSAQAPSRDEVGAIILEHMKLPQQEEPTNE